MKKFLWGALAFGLGWVAGWMTGWPILGALSARAFMAAYRRKQEQVAQVLEQFAVPFNPTEEDPQAVGNWVTENLPPTIKVHDMQLSDDDEVVVTVAKGKAEWATKELAKALGVAYLEQ